MKLKVDCKQKNGYYRAMNEHRGTFATVLVALLVAVLVAIVFSVIDAVDEHSGTAGIITFIVLLLAGLFGRR